MLQIPLSPDTEKILRERAREQGQDVTVYVARIIQDALSAPSVDDLLAPFRKQVEESDISDQELDTFGESLRDEVWKESKGKKAKSA